LEDGKIKVLNKGRDIKKDKYKDIEGTAEVPDPKYPGRLKVTFFKPFSADYYIFKVDDNYQYALVGSPNLKFLWVLSRNANLDDEIYQELLEIAESLGFDITQMEKINQDC
jgi:lipocalin